MTIDYQLHWANGSIASPANVGREGMGRRKVGEEELVSPNMVKAILNPVAILNGGLSPDDIETIYHCGNDKMHYLLLNQ